MGNPMWRLRRGKLAEAEKGETPLPLKYGDVIVIFTGAEDCTPDGPGNLGTLLWTFSTDEDEAADDDYQAQEREAPPTDPKVNHFNMPGDRDCEMPGMMDLFQAFVGLNVSGNRADRAAGGQSSNARQRSLTPTPRNKLSVSFDRQ